MRVASIALFAALLPVAAQANPQRGTMTVTFKYQAVSVKPQQDFDGVWESRTSIDQTTTMTCPMFNDGVSSRSQFDGSNAAQQSADAELGKAVEADASEMQRDGTMAKMNNLEAMMKSCKAKGGSDQSCAMQVMQAMQNDQAYMEGMGRTGSRSRAAAPKVDAVAGKFEIWFSEGCTGTLTANNRTTLSKGGVVKNIETIVGKRPISNADANVTVETDLAAASSRVRIVTPVATGLPRTALGDNRREARVTALPEGNVNAGPTPGGIKGGRLSKKLPGGSYDVEWTFVRGK